MFLKIGYNTNVISVYSILIITSSQKLNIYQLDFSNSLAALAARSKAEESNLYASPLDDGGGDGFFSETLSMFSKFDGSGLLPPIPKIHDMITEI